MTVSSKMFKGSLFLLVLLFSVFVHADILITPDNQNKIVGVRLSDLNRYLPGVIPRIGELNRAIYNNPRRYFLYANSKSKILNLFLRELPKKDDDGYINLKLGAFLKYNKKKFEFETFNIKYRDNSNSGFHISNRRFIYLNDTLFSLQIGLIERKLVLRDSTYGLLMVFPVGVGAFDAQVENKEQVALLTSRIRNGFIYKEAAVEKRKKPKYYQKKPFIRVLNKKGSGGFTQFGLHIKQNEVFRRGFDSHGCMRLREHDLFALFYLLKKGNKSYLPLSMTYRVEDKADHPLPYWTKFYQEVANFGTKAAPECRRKGGGLIFNKHPPLVLMRKVRNTPPPVHLLNDLTDIANPEKRNCLTKKQLKMKKKAERKLLGNVKIMSELNANLDSRKAELEIEAARNQTGGQFDYYIRISAYDYDEDKVKKEKKEISKLEKEIESLRVKNNEIKQTIRDLESLESL